MNETKFDLQAQIDCAKKMYRDELNERMRLKRVQDHLMFLIKSHCSNDVRYLAETLTESK